MDKASTKKSMTDEMPVLTLRDMVSPLFRKKRVVLLTFLAIFLAATVVAWGWANKRYVSTMQVVVGRERSEPTVSPQASAALQETNKTVTTDDVASEVALLQGQDMYREVAQSCKLTDGDASFWDRFDSRSPDVEKAAALEGATKALASTIKVEAQKLSHVIDLRYGSSSPETAACVLQTLGKLYLAKHLRLQRPAGAFDFFAQETEKYERALAESESQLVDFSRTEGIAAPDVVRTDMAQELVQAYANLYHARQAIAADTQRIENIKAQMAVTPARSSTAEASISANLLLDQLHSTQLAAQLKRTQLLLKYDPSFPLVKEIDEEIAQTKEAIASAEAAKYVNKTTDRDTTFEYLRQDEARTKADLASEVATATAVENTIHSMQSEMVSLDVKAVKHAELLREAKANEANYLLYLDKREQERTSDALDRSRIADVAIAVPAYVPVLPAHSPYFVMFAGFFIAVLGGVVAGYLAELVDPSFRTADEVAEILNIPVLASVPRKAA